VSLSTSLDRRLQQDLDARRDANRLRIPAERPPRTISFCGNDYLGLADEPALRAAVADAAREDGTGATGSRLVSGSHPAHARVEAELAAWLDAPSALLFPSGWQANTGLLAALGREGDVYFSDALNHASLIDGMRMSRARRVVFPHNDVDALDDALRRTPCAGHRVVVTEAIFSMDGDAAPLDDLLACCEAHDALLVLDEAHALGVIGPKGAGLAAELGVADRVAIRLGTGGKSLGAAGGFVLGSETLRTWMWNHVRSFVYSTGVALPVVAALGAALPLVQEDTRRDALRERRERLARGLDLPSPAAAILPLPLGSERHAVEVASQLAAAGWHVQAIRPPTVPTGTSRLRVTARATHSLAEIDSFCEAYRALRERRAPPSSEPR
jgi:8-amino-7-oxononanoate synthase